MLCGIYCHVNTSGKHLANNTSESEPSDGKVVPLPQSRGRGRSKGSKNKRAIDAARRQRRHRARRKQGRFVVPVEVTCEMIMALVDQGDVDEANSRNLDCVGEAIAAAARRDLDLT